MWWQLWQFILDQGSGTPAHHHWLDARFLESRHPGGQGIVLYHQGPPEHAASRTGPQTPGGLEGQSGVKSIEKIYIYYLIICMWKDPIGRFLLQEVNFVVKTWEQLNWNTLPHDLQYFFIGFSKSCGFSNHEVLVKVMLSKIWRFYIIFYLWIIIFKIFKKR